MFDNYELYLQTFLQAPAAIALVSMEGECFKTNKMFTEWLGYEEDEMRGRNFHDLTFAADVKAERALIDQLRDGQRSHFRLDKRWIHKRGHLVSAFQSVSIARKDNRPLYYTFFIHPSASQSDPLSQMTNALTELSESQEQLRRALEIASTGTSLVDAQTRIIKTDFVLQRMLGYTEEELVNKSFHELTHPDDVESNRVLYQELIEGKRDHYRMEKRYIRKDGKVVWGALTVCLIHQDPPLITTLIEDITQRKKLEFRLQESERRFRMIAEHVRDIICIRDRDGKYTYISPATIHLLGYREQELLGLSSFELIHPEDRASSQHDFKKLMKLEHITATYRMRKKCGEYIWLESKMQVFRDADGTIQIITISRDVSKYKRREQQLQATQRLWKRLSILDGVTEIFNRRHFEESLKREWERCGKHSKPLSLLLLDIDYFKEYNDTYGHQEGDRCLKAVAQTIKRSLRRPLDAVFRYGGEEFAVLLPETNAYGAKLVAERIRAVIEGLRIPHRQSKISDRVTISVGCATRQPTARLNANELVARADEALYVSKHRGRNQVTVWME